VINDAGKVVPIPKQHAMKTYGGLEVKLHAFLTLAQVGGEWSASCSCCCSCKERGPSTHWIGIQVGRHQSNLSGQVGLFPSRKIKFWLFSP
jgi:hypothetical protein